MFLFNITSHLPLLPTEFSLEQKNARESRPHCTDDSQHLDEGMMHIKVDMLASFHCRLKPLS